MRVIYHFVTCLLATILLFTSNCYAEDLTLGGTRLIYNASKKGANIEFTNTSANTYYLVQSWLSHYIEDVECRDFVK